MLKNRVAVITGAGNGLGKAYAISMARQGAKIIVNDLGTSFDGEGSSSEAADEVVKLIVWKNGHFTSDELAELIPVTLTKGRTRENLPNTLPFSLTIPEEE